MMMLDPQRVVLTPPPPPGLILSGVDPSPIEQNIVENGSNLNKNDSTTDLKQAKLVSAQESPRIDIIEQTAHVTNSCIKIS